MAKKTSTRTRQRNAQLMANQLAELSGLSGTGVTSY